MLMFVVLAVSVSAGFCKDTVTGQCRESVVCLQYDTLAQCQGSRYCYCPSSNLEYCIQRVGMDCDANPFNADGYCFYFYDVLGSTSAKLTCETVLGSVLHVDPEPPSNNIFDQIGDFVDNIGNIGSEVGESVGSAVTLVDKVLLVAKVFLILIVLLIFIPIIFVAVGVFASIIALIKRLFK